MPPIPKPIAKSLTELVALRAETHPEKIAIHTGAAEFGDQIKSLSFLDVRKAIDRLCEYYASTGVQIRSQEAAAPTQTIAILTSSSIEETILELCCIKLGFTPLLLSVNNSAAAVAHLCKVTGAKRLIFESKHQDTADEANTILEGQDYGLDLIPEKRFPLWGEGGVRDSEIAVFPARLRPEDEATRPCVILHSSGSTGFPKPVSITHASLLAMAALVPSGNGFSGVPVYHAFGHFNVLRAFCHADPVTLLPPHLPATAANIIRIIKASPSPPQHLYAVPYVLKLLAETEAGMSILTSMETVSSAGAAMPDELGDRMVEAGAPLVSFYGTTETGGIMSSLRDCKVDKAWNWLRAEGPVANYLEFAPQGSGTFEVIVKDGWPPKIMANREDGAYCTKDLVVRHPAHPTWYKYIGRMDDTLTQTLGEKTNPVPIELAIRGNSPLVAECIVFGDARPQVGALILPSDAGAELSKDKEAFLDAIWPVVLEANARAPSHSRLLRDMIEILPYGTEVPLAPKLTIIRPACYAKFADIINAVYERFEQGQTGPKRKIDNQEEMEAYLVQVITKVLGPKAAGTLDPSTDLFALGVDSLQATTVRNVLFKTLDLGGWKLGQNVVYEHPSVRQLALYLLDIGSGKSSTEQSIGSDAKVLAMVDKWSARLVDQPAHPAEAINGSSGEVVVLTGATGSLGVHILVQLLRRPEVHKVICLSRAKSDEDSLRRINDSLSRRLCSLNHTSRDKIVSYAANVNVPNLGLSPEVYDTLRREATAVIHNAWPVNFVLSIESFDEHIGGAVNLLNLTLASPRTKKPAFFFSSSVAASLGTQDSVVLETFSDSPRAATMGYGQSKWIVEKICERAAERTSARTGILRIGQIVGDTEHGVWNETEAWPLMFKAANSTGVMPLLEDEKLLWLPVDQAAHAIVEVVLSQTEAKSAVYHILNTRSGDWKEVLDGLKAGGLRFEAVDRTEWIKRLAASDSDVAKNPAYKLLGFYQANFGTKHDKTPPVFSVEKTRGISPIIAKTEPISADLVALWTKHWRRTGFLQ